MPSNYEAVKRHRLRQAAKARGYEAMLEVLRIYLEALSQRAPTEHDVIDLLEKLCVASGEKSLLKRVHMLKSAHQ